MTDILTYYIHQVSSVKSKASPQSGLEVANTLPVD
jgi:hypothetical protein